MTSFGLDVKGFVCEYKKRSAWFGSFEIRYIVIEEERMKVFKNEKDYVSSKKRHSKPSLTVVLRNSRLKIMSEQRHPHILSIQVRGTHHCLSFVNKEQLLDCQNSMRKVIESANLIRPTIEQQHLQTQPNIDQKDLNTKYRAILTNLGLPSNKIEELIISQSFVSKMEIVTENQSSLQVNISSKNKQERKTKEIRHWIKLLRRPQNVTLVSLTDIATLLYEQSDEWMIDFINEQGLTLLVSIIPYQINNVKYQIELLQCFKTICDKTYENDKIGLKYIVNDSTAIQGIIDLFDSQDPQVSILIIKLLSVICWHSPQGFEKVIDGLENYCDTMQNQSMWIPIITDLKTMIGEISNYDDDDDDDDDIYMNQFAFEYVLYSISLINAILNSFTNLEDRVSYRKDLEQLGFDKIVSYLSDLIISMEETLYDNNSIDNNSNDSFIDDPWIDKMDQHLDLYQAVKLKDMRDSSLDNIDVSNPIDLFEFLHTNCVEDGFLNEFTHILQCLTTIPRNAPYVWSTIEKIVSYSTAPVRKQQLIDYNNDNDNDNDNDNQKLKDDLIALEQDPEDAFPSFDQLKIMLSRYDSDLAYMETESIHYKEQIALLQEQITNLKYQLGTQQIKFDKFTQEYKKLKVPKDDFYNVLNKSKENMKKKKEKKHKRKTSLLEKMGISGMFQSKTNLTLSAMNDGDSDEDQNNHIIDVHNAWENINDNKSPQSLNTSTTQHTPPPPPPINDALIISHTPSSSITNTNHKQPRGYTLRSPTNTSLTSIVPIAPITPITPQPGVASIGLPPPNIMSQPNSPTKNQNIITENKQNIDIIPVVNITKSDPQTQLLKYLKMLKVGLPQICVENKMRQDKIDVILLTEYLKNHQNGTNITNITNIPNTNNKQSEAPEKLKKYLKMVQLKIPMRVIENKMKQNGDNIKDLHNWLNPVKKKQKEAPPPELSKYLRMIKMKIPLHVVENKMKQNGDSDKIQNLIDWLNPVKKKKKEAPPELSKYLRMIKMKIPLNVVENKMKQNGDSNKINILTDWLNGTTSSSSSSSSTSSISKPKSDANALPPGMKPKPKINPNKKMKNLHWQMIKPKDIKNTIWDDIDDTKINIDIKIFESMFQRKVGKIGDKNKNKNKNKKEEKKQNEEIHLIDGKRSYNVDIGLNRFKLSHQQIKNAILLMDEKILNLDKVIKLRNYIPNTNEQEELRNFDGDVTLLAHTERFFLALCNISDLTLRMELFEFKLQFKELLILQQDRIKILRKSHNNIKNSESFKIILQYVLAFGNYMNGGTRKGQAFGFKLSSLKQIGSAKSIDNKTTLLHYLYMEVEGKNKNALKFIQDFQILAEGSRLDVTDITAEVNKIGSSINKIRKKLESNNKSSNNIVLSPSSMKNDRFNEKMSLFLSEAEPHYNKLKKDHDSVKNDCIKLSEFFNCKNDIKFEFFKDLYEFMIKFKSIGIEVQKKREKEAKELKAEQYKAKRRERLNKNNKNNKNKELTNGNKAKHRRTSSNRANKLYSKNGLNKTNSQSIDPQFAAIMNKQNNKNGTNSNSTKPQSYAKRRQSRNTTYMKRKSPRKQPISPRTFINNHENEYKSDLSSLNNDNNIIKRSQTSPIKQSQTVNSNSLFSMNGLPPPPPQLDENFDDHNVNPEITENVVNIMVENRRKASSQISRNKNRTPKKYKNKKRKWFG